MVSKRYVTGSIPSTTGLQRIRPSGNKQVYNFNIFSMEQIQKTNKQTKKSLESSYSIKVWA